MNSPRYGLVTEIIDDGMSVALAIVKIGYVLYPIGKRVTIRTGAKRHVVSLVSAVQPVSDAARHIERWRSQVLFNGADAERRAYRHKEGGGGRIPFLAQQAVSNDGAKRVGDWDRPASKAERCRPQPPEYAGA